MKTLLTTTAIALLLARAAQAEGELNIYVWSDSIAPDTSGLSL